MTGTGVTPIIQIQSIEFESMERAIVQFRLDQDSSTPPVILSEVVEPPDGKVGMSYDQIVSTARLQLIDRMGKAISALEETQKNYQQIARG